MEADAVEMDRGYSESNYRKLLGILLNEGYKTLRFDSKPVESKVVYLRHDIDYSLEHAAAFAEINHSMGVRATFFFQLRSPLYNLWSFSARKTLARIQECGQDIGFHVVLSGEESTFAGLADRVVEDYRVFQKVVKDTIPVFAWHNPGIMFRDESRKPLLSKEVPGFVNVYGMIGAARIPYYADSNMRYAFSELVGFIRLGLPVLQLALAPFQWMVQRPNMINAMTAVMVQRIREQEPEFMSNNVWNRMFPRGLPNELLDAMEQEIVRYTDDCRD